MKNFVKLFLTSVLGIAIFASAANAADRNTQDLTNSYNSNPDSNSNTNNPRINPGNPQPNHTLASLDNVRDTARDNRAKEKVKTATKKRANRTVNGTGAAGAPAAANNIPATAGVGAAGN